MDTEKQNNMQNKEVEPVEIEKQDGLNSLQNDGIKFGGDSGPQIIEKKNNNNRKGLIIGCVIGGVIFVVMIVIVCLLIFAKGGNVVTGTWNCTRYLYSDNSYNNAPTVTMKLGEDGTFVYGEYGDLDNNHFAGTYEANAIDKNGIAGTSYYKLTFGPTQEYVLEGIKQNTSYRQMSNMEIGVSVNGNYREATLIDEKSYVTFNCKAE